MSDTLLDKIFTRQEALISCSSLRTLDTSVFRAAREEVSLSIFDDSVEILFSNFRRNMEDSARRIAQNVRKQFPQADRGELVTQILMNRRYRRGKRHDNCLDMIRDMVARRMSKNEPVQVTISLFPCKIPNRLKSAGVLPDLAEVASLARLSEIGRAVSFIYPPGAKVVVLTDGRRFEHIMNFDGEKIVRYQEQMERIVSKLGVGDYVTLIDYVGFLEKNLSSEKISEKRQLYERLHQEYGDRVGTEIPAERAKEYIEKLQADHPNADIIQKITTLYCSLIYCSYVPRIMESAQPDELSKKVYSDPFDLFNGEKGIIDLRRRIIRDTWDITSRYVAEIASGRVARPVEEVFPESIRSDMHNIPQRLTLYSVDRSTPLTAFHGSGYIDRKLRVGTRFRVSLQSEDYAPVFGRMLGTDYHDQPLFYFPYHDGMSKTLGDGIAEEVHLR